MAKATVTTQDRRIYRTYDWLRIGLLGAALGVVGLAIAWLLGSYIIDPLVCRSGALTACGQSDVMAGNIAAIIVAAVGIGLLIRLRAHRAFGVALATLVAYWNTSVLLRDLGWFEAAGWMAVLYALAYLLFAHIFRIRSMFVSIIITIVMALALRWVAFL